MNSININELYNILPDGHMEGNEYIALNPTRFDKNKGSFKINIITGRWADFTTNEKGQGPVSLRRYLNKGDNRIYSKQNTHYSPTIHLNRKARAEYIQDIWQKSELLHKNSVVYKYLHNRSINPELFDMEYIRQTKLKHTPSSKLCDVMLAGITTYPNNKIVALHRTYLTPEGQKIPIDPKMMLGSSKGNSITIKPNLSNIYIENYDMNCIYTRIHPEQFHKCLIITEGIEDALSFFPSLQITRIVALSASNIKEITITNDVGTVIIAGDNDKAGIDGSHAAARQWSHLNIRILLITPNFAKDFNAMLKKREENA